MKKVLLLLLIISCGRNNEEQMFYDFMDDLSIKNVNMSLKDLDFEIISLNKVGKLIASDSIDILENELSDLKKTLDEDKVYIEEHLKKKEDTELENSKTNNLELQNLYKKMLDLVQEQIDIKSEYSEKRQLSFDKTSARLTELKANPNQVISTKYEITYSMHMPDTDIRNTFKGFAYTNSDNSKFIRVIE